MKTTKELIQELVGLCVKKSDTYNMELNIKNIGHIKFFRISVDGERFYDGSATENVVTTLQAAIERVRGL